MAELLEAKELLGKSTLKEIVDRADKIQSKCHDYKVSKVTLKNVMYKDGELKFIDNKGDVEHLPMSRYSLSQLCTKIGVPPVYMQKCLETGRLDLASDNMNSWLDDYKKDLFIREYAGHIRGVLSGKYSSFDTPDILKVLRDTVDLRRFKVKESFLNEERLHIRLVGKDMLPIDGEDLFPGLFVDSSDVGRNVLTVQFGIYKLVCTNGLVISRGSGNLYTQKHIGIKPEEFYAGLNSSLKKVDELCEHAVDLVHSAQSRSSHYNTSKLSQEDFDAFLAQIKNRTKLSDKGASKVIDLMKTKYGDSRWGYINSITEVAQDYTLERRLELERIAGSILVA